MRWLPPLVGLAVGTLLLGPLASCGQEGSGIAPAPLTDTGAVAQATWDGWYKQVKDRIPADKVRSPGEPWGSFVGSRACGGCHTEEYAKWRKSFHSRTLYEAVDGTVIGDFQGSRLDVQALLDLPSGERIGPMGAPYMGEVFTRPDAEGRLRFYMTIRERTEAEGWDPKYSRNTYGHGDPSIHLPRIGRGTTQEIRFTFGNRRHQPYVAQWKAEPGDAVNEGAYWVLPFFYNDAEKQWMYCGFRRYSDSCASCHTTGLKTSPVAWWSEQTAMAVTPEGQKLFNLPPRQEGWAEGAVGCENCHGPGLEHVRQVDKVGVRLYAELRRTNRKPPSIFPSKRGSETLERLTQQCDSCHNFHTESGITFVPGPNGYGRDAGHTPLDPRQDHYHMQHYPDGSKKSPCSIGTVYRASKMFHEGVACFDCHDPHGSDHFGSLKLPIEDNALCLSCHVAYTEVPDQIAHSRHKAGSPGNRCVECHMPRHMVFTNGQQSMSDRIHNHILSVPKGGAREGSPPTSCNICHKDRDEGWSAAEIRRLWPAKAGGVPAPEVRNPAHDAPGAPLPGPPGGAGGVPPPGDALPPDPQDEPPKDAPKPR